MSKKKQPMPNLFADIPSLFENAQAPATNEQAAPKAGKRADAARPAPLTDARHTRPEHQSFGTGASDHEPVWEQMPDHEPVWEQVPDEAYDEWDEESWHEHTTSESDELAPQAIRTERARAADESWSDEEREALLRRWPRPEGLASHIEWPPPPFGQRWTRVRR